LDMENKNKDLDTENSAILNKQRWFLVTYFQCRKDADVCKSKERAISKANSIKRETGIRTVEKDEHIVFEVWEKW